MSMNKDDHAHAREAVLQRRIEGLFVETQTWLESHLAACEDCMRYGDLMEDRLGAFIATPVAAPPELVHATQELVRQRAAALSEQRAGMWLLAMSCVAGIGSSAVVFIPLWQEVVSLGTRLNIPESIELLLFSFVWFLPATLAAFTILLLPTCWRPSIIRDEVRS